MEVSAIMECWDESRMLGCLLISTCSRLDGCLTLFGRVASGSE